MNACFAVKYYELKKWLTPAAYSFEKKLSITMDFHCFDALKMNFRSKLWENVVKLLVFTVV